VAWLLRRLPVFAVGGRGSYRVRGIHVDDLARLCVELGARDDTVVVDAVGPQRVTFQELVAAVRSAVGSHALVVPVPGALLPAASRVLGVLLRDTLVTRENTWPWPTASPIPTLQRRAGSFSPTGWPSTGTSWAGAMRTSWTGTSAVVLGRSGVALKREAGQRNPADPALSA
jgi:hypothetical protein